MNTSQVQLKEEDGQQETPVTVNPQSKQTKKSFSSQVLAIVVKAYCRYIWRRPGLAKRVLFYVPDWQTLYRTALNEIYYLLRRDCGYKLTCAVVELAAHCNLDCTICARHDVMKREEGYMSMETFKKLVDNNPEINAYILVGWGEMMLSKIFWPCVDLLNERGKRIALTTNATTLNDANVERLVQSGISHVTISMDGMGSVYEKIRGFSYEKVEANLIRLSDRIKETGTDIYLEINAAGTPAVLAQAKETRERLGPYVDDIRFSSYIEYNKNLKTNRTKPCREFWRGMITIWWDGAVVPCCMDYNTSMKMGSSSDTPLQALWNDEANRKFRREQLRGEYKRRCATCYEAIPPKNDAGVESRFVD